ncbi:MAG: phosphoribosylanthranilate isomerase [Armatimonadetes bacterium]|nr:phosphoribosylanthranilate isomerase [Armatimonadota bacterium]
MTQIKVCGITNIDDAIACAELGADMLGFVFADSPRQVSIEQVIEIVREISSIQPNPSTILRVLAGISLQHPTSNNQPLVRAVGVFVEDQQIAEIIKRCGLDFAQLHGNQSDEIAQMIGKERVIRVGRIKNESSIEALKQYPTATYYLLDTYKKGQPGGTGETFNWELAIAAKSLGKPIILSGGLNPDNIFDAIRAVRPFGIDVSSGVEKSSGRKDLKKVKEFINHVREADNAS